MVIFHSYVSLPEGNWSHLVHFAIFRRRDFDSCLAHTGTGWNTMLCLHKLARSTHQGVVKDALRMANINVLWSSGSFSMNLKAPLDICWTGFPCHLRQRPLFEYTSAEDLWLRLITYLIGEGRSITERWWYLKDKMIQTRGTTTYRLAMPSYNARYRPWTCHSWPVPCT